MRYLSFTIITYVSRPRRFKDKMAIRIARMVTRVEIVPVTARPPVEKRVPRRGVRRVVPQVGQPAPRAMRPVMMPAFSTLAELLESLLWRFLSQRRMMRPISVPCNRQIAKIGSQSRNG